MAAPYTYLTFDQCQQARLSRDPRFDGKFFIGVKTTGIFCRTVCPAKLPKEENVEYFSDKTQAMQAGYRPCLRCRPDSAPASWAWKGVEATFSRAARLIEQGGLDHQSLASLCTRLGITDRYLRKLFSRYLGMSPKQYDLHNKLLFASQLLHSSTLSVTDIAYSSGFNSTRRFNDAFRKQLRMSPSDLRKKRPILNKQGVVLPYRGTLNWAHMLEFYRLRAIEGLEQVGEQSYSRYVQVNNQVAWFKVYPGHQSGRLTLEFSINEMTLLKPLMNQVRRMLDLDTDTNLIEQHLTQLEPDLIKNRGLRIPGVWNIWEAGVRAIIGQQVSVKAAINQLNNLVHTINPDTRLPTFPEPDDLIRADLSFLKMPQSRKDTLKRFAQYIQTHPESDPQEWIKIKGIGPWTISYAQLRGLSLPDRFLDSDLVVKKALSAFPSLTSQSVSPWGSYATFHLWNQ